MSGAAAVPDEPQAASAAAPTAAPATAAPALRTERRECGSAVIPVDTDAAPVRFTPFRNDRCAALWLVLCREP
ncbi:hypothetical protein GCM10023192_09100 [Amycolatopsis samaneae]